MESCYLCHDDAPETDRWEFNFGYQKCFLCRSCHADFDSIEQFNNFIQNWNKQRMYSAAKRLAKLIAHGAPNVIVANCASNLLRKIFKDENIFSHINID